MRSYYTLIAVVTGIAVTGCEVKVQQIPPPKQKANTQLEEDGSPEASAGLRLLRQNKPAEAIPLLESALAKPLSRHSRPLLLTSLGLCYYELGNYEKSLKLHDEALEFEESKFLALVHKGMALHATNRLDEAEAVYLQAEVLNPEYLQLYISLCSLALDQRDLEKAIRYGEKAVTLNVTVGKAEDGAVAAAHEILAACYTYAKRFEDARRQIELARGAGLPAAKVDHIQRMIAAFELRSSPNHVTKDPSRKESGNSATLPDAHQPLIAPKP